MHLGAGYAADWRDAEAYAPLLDAERPLLAWEWLRRNDAFKEAAKAALAKGPAKTGRILEANPAAARWHLHAWEDPDLSAPEARPVWRADRHKLVLKADARPGGPISDAFLVQRLGGLVTCVRSTVGEHHLLSDGWRSVRLDIIRGSLFSGPVQLHYRLTGMEAVDAPLLVLRRLLSLWRTKRFLRSLHPRPTNARRLVLTLRAYDALMSGATQREIATELIDAEAREGRWRVRAAPARSSAQRLARAARLMARGGYLSLLDA